MNTTHPPCPSIPASPQPRTRRLLGATLLLAIAASASPLAAAPGDLDPTFAPSVAIDSIATQATEIMSLLFPILGRCPIRAWRN